MPVDCSKETNPIVIAAFQNDVKKLKEIVTKDNVDATSQAGLTAFTCAFLHNNMEAAEFLYQMGANLNFVDSSNVTLLMGMARRNDLVKAKWLCEKGADIHFESSQGYTAVMFAMAGNNHEVLEYLVTRGADINHADDRGRNGLMILMEVSGRNLKNLGMLPLLLKMGIDVDHADNQGRTIAHYAAPLEKPWMMILVQHGVDWEVVDCNGYTSIMLSLMAHQIPTTQYLLNISTKKYIEKATVDGKTIASIAGDLCKANKTPVFSEVIEHEILSRALHEACKTGNLEQVKALIPKDASVGPRTLHLMTPLMWAVLQNHVEVVLFLLKMIPVNQLIMANVNKNIPLMLAILKGNLKMVQLLLSRSAIEQLLLKDKNGSTPLMLAIELQHFTIVQFLLSDRRFVYPQLNAKNRLGQTPLMLSIIHDSQKEAHSEITSLIIDAVGSRNLSELPKMLESLNERDARQKTALMVAVEEGHRMAARNLLQFSAKEQLKCQDAQGKTPLHIAAECQDDIVLQNMIERPTCTDDLLFIPDNQGRTVFDYIDLNKQNGVFSFRTLHHLRLVKVQFDKEKTPKAEPTPDWMSKPVPMVVSRKVPACASDFAALITKTELQFEFMIECHEKERQQSKGQQQSSPNQQQSSPKENTSKPQKECLPKSQ